MKRQYFGQTVELMFKNCASFPSFLASFRVLIMEGKPNYEWAKVVTSRPLALRSGEELSSDLVGEIPPGSLVQLFEAFELDNGTRRVRCAKGWCTSVSRTNKVMLRGVIKPERPNIHGTPWPGGHELYAPVGGKAP